ncbi:DUF805 domain-containing protein [Massilia sp. CCM 8733]|uniref:DUF805 domain-containing protein n=1 Tax=Massilia mucilaginosa TaxID=2609282 RepID=A0ABX0NP38_9BURK|nr:DUF805 domain-containing protein [Massilia mucilaginosa]NHZ88546.1 DUF805 domain-containing protein [Massilia mucilaginosa]
MTGSENFEQVLAAAQAGGSLHPAWKKLVNTRFFVAVLAPAGGNAGHTLRAPGGVLSIPISEVRERVDGGAGGLLVALSGAEVVRLVPGGCAIAVVLSERTFEIDGERVAWLRKSIDAALVKAAQAREAAVPAPVPVSVPATAPAPPRSPVVLGKTERAAAQRRARAAARDATREAESMHVHAESAESMHMAPEPSLFALSMQGRAGRMRAIAYSLPLLVLLGILSVIGLRFASQFQWAALTPVVAAAVMVLYWMIRLMVLRLHDVSLSGVWLGGVVLLVVIGGFVGGEPLAALVSTIFWLGTIIVCALIPGTDGANDYGPAPGPNSILVKVGGWLFILAYLGSLGTRSMLRDEAGRADSTPPSAGADAGTWQPAPAGSAGKAGPAGPAWTSPDGAMTIAFPVKPYEDAVRANVLQRMGAVRMRQFSAFAHSENYRVQVLDLDAAPTDPETVMLQAQASLLAHSDVMTVPPTESSVDGHPGRDIKAGQRLIRMVVVGATVYIVTVDADPAPASMARAGAFIESMVLNR